MGTTSNRAYRYPASTDHTRLWEHIQNLATDVDNDVAAIVASLGTGVGFTPILYSQSTGARAAITKTITNAAYVQLGKLVICWADVTATAGSAGGASLSLPFQAAVRQIVCGTALIMGGTAPVETGLAYMTAALDSVFCGSTNAAFADIVSGQTFRYQCTYLKV